MNGKRLVIFGIVLLMSGCAAQPTTVADARDCVLGPKKVPHGSTTCFRCHLIPGQLDEPRQRAVCNNGSWEFTGACGNC